MAKPTKPAAAPATDTKNAEDPVEKKEPADDAANAETEDPAGGNENPETGNGPEKDASGERPGEGSGGADDPLVKTGFRKIRVAEFRGSYRDTWFSDDGEAEISAATYDAFRAEFPGAVVEDI